MVNRGLSGYNTSQALRLLPEIFSPPGPGVPKIDYLIVLFGANDAVIPMETTHQGIDKDAYRRNLREIVTHDIFCAHKPKKILLVTPPPVDEIKTTPADKAWGHPLPCREAKRSAQYSQIAREVAAEVGEPVVLVDLWKAIMEKAISMTPERNEFHRSGSPYLGDPECGLQGGLDVLLPDGLHMNGDAYRAFADLVLPHMKPEYATLPPGNKSDYVWPDWRVMPWLEKDTQEQGPSKGHAYDRVRQYYA